MRAQEIQELFAYDRWASRQLLDGLAAVTPETLTKDLGSSFPSIRDTLAHLIGAEWIWLRRWKGTSPRAMPEGWGGSGLADLRARFDEVGAEVREYVAGLSEPDLDRVVHYETLKGEAFSSPLWQLLRHVANHSSYHRGQVVTMLRQVGAKPPSTDLVLWYRKGKPSA
jgi:uncharacterized damage-inducible protein DinB